MALTIRRLLAALIDIILLLNGAAVVLVSAQMLLDETMWTATAWLYTSALSFVLGYFVICESRYGQGQTIGKRVFSLRVISVGGQPLSLCVSLFRTLLRLGIGILVVGGTLTYQTSWVLAGAIAIAASLFYPTSLVLCRGHRTAHDFAVGSVVVYSSEPKCIPTPPLKMILALTLSLGIGFSSTALLRVKSGVTDPVPPELYGRVSEDIDPSSQYLLTDDDGMRLSREILNVRVLVMPSESFEIDEQLAAVPAIVRDAIPNQKLTVTVEVTVTNRAYDSFLARHALLVRLARHFGPVMVSGATEQITFLKVWVKTQRRFGPATLSSGSTQLIAFVKAEKEEFGATPLDLRGRRQLEFEIRVTPPSINESF